MALSDPRGVFGVHSFTPYNFTTGDFFGTIKVLANSNLVLDGALIPLNAGSSRFPWATEEGLITAELSLAFSQFEDFMFELFLGKSPTANAAEATGSVTTLTDKSGTVIDATEGIASIGLLSGSSADLKFGKYVVKVISGTTVDVFFSSDADITRGTDGTYANDLLKITATPLTIPNTSATVTIPNFGLEFVGGSGTIDLESNGAIGDTATFSVRPNNTKSMDVTIGGTADVAPRFGAILMAEKRNQGEMFEIDCFSCKASGMPLPLTAKEWAQAEVTATLNYDAARDGVFSIRHVTPTVL